MNIHFADLRSHVITRFGALLLLSVSLLVFSGSSLAAGETHGVGVKKLTLIDNSRSIDAFGEFPGSEERRIDVIVWYPASGDSDEPAEGGPWPLVVYSHGTLGAPDNATHFVEHLVRHGYIVAAPAFPLTSRSSFAGISAPGLFDTSNQVGDVGFVIDRLLDTTFGAVIDDDRIGCAGHSLGAITCYFASFGLQTRDPRIAASAMLGAGDPVQAALASDFGFDGVNHAAVSVPALFLSADRDLFARMGGRPHAAYSRLEPPKYEVMIEGGNHVWFRDGADTLPDGKNPDCLFFERNMPGAAIPGCEVRGGLIEPLRQQEITREALLVFFDAYLKDRLRGEAALRNLGEKYGDVKLRFSAE